MGLRNLKTNLKSLKYGNDTVGGGWSRQPFIIKPIPDSWNDIGRTGGVDTLVRGGSLLPVSTIDDVSRVRKLLTNFSSLAGTTFVAKTNILSKQSVRTQTNTLTLPQGKTDLARILANVATVAYGGHTDLFKTERYYDLFRVREGISSVYSNSANRLVYLTQAKISNTARHKFGENVNQQQIFIIDPTVSAQNQGYNLGNAQTVYSYQGGPGGDTTLIRLQNPTVKGSPGLYAVDNVYLSRFTQVPNVQLIANSTLLGKYNGYVTGSQAGASAKNLPQQANTTGYADWLWDAKQISESFPVDRNNGQTVDFRARVGVNPKFGATYGIYKSPLIFGTPGAKSTISNYNNPDSARGQNAYQANPGTNLVNFKYIYSNPDQSVDPLYDFVDFYIAVYPNADINPKHRITYIHFPAYITGLSDNYNPEWEKFRVMGRGENFYTYQGFTRQISLNFKVFAQSKPELLRQKYKLDYLASLMYPDYSQAGVMQGNFVEVTIGDWVRNMPGIIEGFSFNVPDESPWQIKDNLQYQNGLPVIPGTTATMDPIYENNAQLPHLIEVQGFKFTPIQNSIPRRIPREQLWYDQLDPAQKRDNGITLQNAWANGAGATQGTLDAANAANTINTEPYNQTGESLIGLDQYTRQINALGNIFG